MKEEEIFHHALEQPVARRAAFLEAACGTDIALRQQIAVLLNAQENPGSFLQQPVCGVADLPSLHEPVLERIGSQIGPYKLLEEIGQGGMGTVYMAEQKMPVRRCVALKIVRAGMDNQQVLARFDVERQALAMMDHPSIARIIDAGTTQLGRPYFVMELVHGIPINEFCDQHRLTVRERLELFLKVCQAVQHAHQKGIIHRDLKPSNVLVTTLDVVAVPKVIDFGIAKAFGSEITDQTRVTGFAQFLGTPQYMSPEQAEMNQLGVDTRTDVYSLGVILYELLTGGTPFDKHTLKTSNFDELRRILLEEEPPNPSSRISTLNAKALSTVSECRGSDSRRMVNVVRGELDWIVMKALEKDRSRRYETAYDLACDIERFLNDEQVQACPPSASYRFRIFARRNKTALSVACVVAATLLIGTGVSLWQAVRAYRAERDAIAGWTEESLQRRNSEMLRSRAVEAELLAENNLAQAREEQRKAEQSQIELEAFSEFLVYDVLAAARPKGVQGGLGVAVTVAQAIEAAEASIEERFKGMPLAEATARDAIGKTWRNLEKFEQAERQLRQAIALRERELGADDATTLDSRNSLGVLLVQAGRYSEAIGVHQKVRDTLLSKLGPNHPSTLNSMCNLAIAFLETNKLDEAIPLFEETLRGQQAALGNEDSETLKTMSALADAYLRDGRIEMAISLQKQALEKQKETLGVDHYDTIISMDILASAYRDAQMFEQALSLYMQTLQLERASFAPGERSLFRTLSNIATAYMEAGRLVEAEPFFREAVAGARRDLGSEHPDTQLHINDLANWNWRMGRFEESVLLYEETLRHAETEMEDELQVERAVVNAYNLAVNYRDAGRWTEAQTLIDQWLPRGREQLGEDHPSLQFGLETAISIHQHQGLPAILEALHRELADFWNVNAGPESPQYSRQLVVYGSFLLDQHKPAEAEAVLRKGLLIREKMEADNWTTFSTRSLLGASLLDQKNFAEAEPLLLSGYEGLQRRKKIIPPASQNRLAEAQERLARLYDEWGQPEKGDEWRKQMATGNSTAVPNQ